MIPAHCPLLAGSSADPSLLLDRSDSARDRRLQIAVGRCRVRVMIDRGSIAYSTGNICYVTHAPSIISAAEVDPQPSENMERSPSRVARAQCVAVSMSDAAQTNAASNFARGAHADLPQTGKPPTPHTVRRHVKVALVHSPAGRGPGVVSPGPPRMRYRGGSSATARSRRACARWSPAAPLPRSLLHLAARRRASSQVQTME